MENKKVVIEFCINTGPANIVDLHPEKAVCPAPVVWMLEFWWHDRRLTALCAAAGHPDPSQTRAEWGWAPAIAWGSPDGPPWLSVLRSGLLSVEKKEKKKYMQEREVDQGQSINTAEGGANLMGILLRSSLLKISSSNK